MPVSSPDTFLSWLFSVLKAYDHLVPNQQIAAIKGCINLMIDGQRIAGRINRTANKNGTARIHGNGSLADWFRANKNVNQTIWARWDGGNVVSLFVEAPTGDQKTAQTAANAGAHQQPVVGAAQNEQVAEGEASFELEEAPDVLEIQELQTHEEDPKRVSFKKKNLIRLSGEFFVASELTRAGYIVALQSGTTVGYDILVFDKQGNTAFVEVKASSKGAKWARAHTEEAEVSGLSEGGFNEGRQFRCRNWADWRRRSCCRCF